MIARNKTHKVHHFIEIKGLTYGPFFTDLKWEEGRWCLIFKGEQEGGGISEEKLPVETDRLEEGRSGYLLEEALPIANPDLENWILQKLLLD